MYLVFKTFSDGTPIFKRSSKHTEYMKKKDRSIPTAIPAKAQDKVHVETCKRVTALHGSSSDREAVLGQCVCQFGAICGQIFKRVA